MSKGDFRGSMRLLKEQTHGKWRAAVEVDQIYAHYQEVHPEFRHPRGGQAFYLRDSLYLGNHLHTVSHGLITSDGAHLEDVLRRVAEQISQGVKTRAPVEFSDLRKSAAPRVERDGVVVWARPPKVRRLGPVELKQKARLRYLFDPNAHPYGRH